MTGDLPSTNIASLSSTEINGRGELLADAFDKKKLIMINYALQWTKLNWQ